LVAMPASVPPRAYQQLAGRRTAALRPTRGRWGIWGAGTLLACGLVATPLVSVVLLSLTDSRGIWSHLAATVLPDYLVTTGLLMLGVGSGTLAIGVATAWLVTMCRFPGKAVFEWALLLPLAMPAYIVAFVYTDLLEYAGPVQGVLRAAFGWASPRDYWFPEIRSLGGAVTMMTLTLYPYVYLLSRAAFLEQSVCVLEVSRTLGRGPLRSFFLVALPLARPAVVIGLSLVLLEALNDFGTVDFFAVKTLTAGIYDVWLNMGSLAGAAQLSTVLLAFVLVLFAAERQARGARGFQHATNRYRALPSYRLRGGLATAAAVLCALPVALGFVLPATVLAWNALGHYQETLAAPFVAYLRNSLELSALAAFLAVLIGLFLAYGVRLTGSRLLRHASRFAAIGYAMPGAMLAVGILVPFGAFDNALDAFAREAFGRSTGLLLSGTLFAVTCGYLVRFLAVGYGAAEASLTKVTASMEGAARTLGEGPFGTLRRLHLPLIRASLVAASLLVFVDGMKELPMTLLLRPFGFETLATFVHQYASDERFEEAALAALAIVAAGLVPVVILSAGMGAARPGKRQSRQAGHPALASAAPGEGFPQAS